MSSFVQPKGTFDFEIGKSKLIEQVATRIMEFPDFKKFKLDLELLKFVCCLFEQLVLPSKQQKIKLNKKELVLCVYEKVFGVIPVNEREQILSNIEFLFINKKIKKNSYLKLALKKSESFFKKRLTII